MKIIETTTKDLVYYINLVHEVGVGCARTESNFERYSTVGKILSNGIAGYREMVHERKNQFMWPSLLSYFKKIATAFSAFNNEYPD